MTKLNTDIPAISMSLQAALAAVQEWEKVKHWRETVNDKTGSVGAQVDWAHGRNLSGYYEVRMEANAIFDDLANKIIEQALDQIEERALKALDTLTKTLTE